MKNNSLKKISLFLSCCILCFMFNASVSGAEPSDKEITNKVVSRTDLERIQGALESTEMFPVVQTITKARDIASSFDVKFAVSERFKAFLSLGRPYIEDLAGRDNGKNYNAMVGFLIVLQ
jgi:hypothetical protein